MPKSGSKLTLWYWERTYDPFGVMAVNVITQWASGFSFSNDSAALLD